MLSLKDKGVALAGRFANESQRSVKALVVALGGKPTASAKTSQDILLVGTNPKEESVDRAHAVGAHVVDDAGAVSALLLGEEVDWPRATGWRPLPELVGECRAIFDGPASRQRWFELIELFDSCLPEQKEALLAYLSPQLERWPERTLYDDMGECAGAIFVAPKKMLTRAMGGHQHPLSGLIKAVSLKDLELPEKLTRRLWSAPSLGDIRVLDMRSRTHYDMRRGHDFMDALRTSEKRHTLHTIILSGLQPSSELLTDLDDLQGLRHLFLDANTMDSLLITQNAHAARLETLGFLSCWNYSRALRDFAPHSKAYTSLKKFCVALPEPSRDHRVAGERVGLALAGLRFWEHVEHLSLSTAYFEVLDAALRDLAKNADLRLKTLSLSGLEHEPLRGERGSKMLLELLQETGLLGQLEALIVNEQVREEVCEQVMAQGLAVKSPHRAAPQAVHMERVEAAADDPEALKAIFGVDYASARGWRVIVSALDELAQQHEPLTGEQRERVHAHLSGWPEHVRTCPWHWLGGVLSQEKAPYLEFATTLTLWADRVAQDARGFTAWLDMLAQAAHIGTFSALYVRQSGEQKSVCKAMAGLIEAAMIERVHVEQGHAALVEYLKTSCEAAIEVREVELKRPIVLSDLKVLEEEHVLLKVTSRAQLGELLERQDMSHVRTLRLELHASVWGGRRSLRAPGLPADWKSLECLETYFDLNASPSSGRELEAVAQWLALARPRHVVTHMARTSTALAQLGVYARARASTVRLESLGERELVALLSQPSLCVAGIDARGEHNARALDSLNQIIQMLHPNTRRALRGWAGALWTKDYGDIERFLQDLPALSVWVPECEDGFYEREGLLKALASSPQTGLLFAINPNTSRHVQKLATSERRRLDKGAGLKSARLLVSALPASFELGQPVLEQKNSSRS